MDVHGLKNSYVVPSAGLLFVDASDHVETEKVHDFQKDPQQLLQSYIGSNDMAYVHEWGHILQAAHYPYLAISALRENGLVDTVLRAIRRNPSELHGTKIALLKEALESFGLSSVYYRLKFDSAKKEWDFNLASGPRRRPSDICEIDLVEEANSIFEFRVEIGSQGDGKTYLDWLSSGPRYSRIFKLLAHAYGLDVAFSILHPIISTCLHTTYPVTALLSLLNSGSSHYWELDQEMIEDVCVSIMRSLLKDNQFIFRQLSAEDKFSFIDDTSMIETIENSSFHPLAPLMHHMWCTGKTRDRDWLYSPYKYIKANGHKVIESFQDYHPPVTLIYFGHHLGLEKGLLGIVSDLYERSETPVGLGEKGNWLQVVLICYTRRVLIENMLGLGIHPQENYCPNKTCGYYNSGLCNGFAFPPNTFDDCMFPKVVQGALHRVYDESEKSLRKEK